MEVVTIANLKGGSGKTTSTAYLAHAYAARGLDVLLVDADPQGSALRWSEDGEWELPTLALPVRNVHARLAGIVPADVDAVFIDTPPLDEQAGIVYSALRAADTIVVTMAPTMLEFERLPDVWAAIDEIEPLRSRPPRAVVLLNRTITRASSTDTFRKLIEDGGHHVLTTTIPRLERIAQAFGGPIIDLGPYAAAADELAQLGASV